MSSDFATILTKDPAIADVTEKLAYAVKSGAASTTYQPFTASSNGNSVLVFSVQVPSENILVARDALVSTPMQFTLLISNVPIGESAIEWGRTASLQAFPLASIMSTATATINNSTTSVNLQDVLPQILRLNNNRELFRHNGTCPSLPDQEFGLYTDAAGANSSPLAAFSNKSYDGDLTPRGAHPCVVQVDRFVGGVWTDGSPISTSAVTNTWRVSVFTTTTEPLFVSPFIYGDPENNKQAMTGINNMNFTFNINTTLNRLVSYAGPGVITIQQGVLPDPRPAANWLVQTGMFAQLAYGLANNVLPRSSAGCAILLRLLSAQPSDVLSTRNVVPYFDLPRYLTSVSNGATIAGNTAVAVSSQAIQLSQLPDYFIIVARKSMASQLVTDTSSFLTIRNISINLNNKSGLISSASIFDLWRLSTKSGSQQSFTEFCGKALKYNPAVAGGSLVATTGSLLVISPTDLSLPDELSCGSLGAFSLQFQCEVFNQFDVPVSNVELCVIACNSGIMVLNQGTTSIYTGMLTRQAIMDTKVQPVADVPDRMIGGMLNRGLAMHPRLARLRERMRGSAMSAGAMSAGKMSKLSGMY